MKLRNMVGALAAATALFAAPAANALDLYVKAEVGTTANSELVTPFGTLEQENGMTFGGRVGVDFEGPFSVEAGLRQESGAVDLGPISVQTDATYADLTGIVDLPYGFYAGGGPTYGQGELTYGPFQGDDSGWGYHALAGLNVPVGEADSVYVQGRYTDVDMEHVEPSGLDFVVGYKHTF